jgi:Photosynthesis system II assembly factor YCF48
VRRLLICVLLATSLHAEKWKRAYFHDADDSVLNFVDLKFPTARRGIAIGVLVEKGKQRGVAVTTNDGGVSWQVNPLQELPVSLFFLNESLGWMVTDGGVWRTQEAGRDWRKIKPVKWMNQVEFFDANHGFLTGRRKQILETFDGGKNWVKLPVLEKLESSADYTTFSEMAFSGKYGMITGGSRPPRTNSGELPEWMESYSKSRRREWPNLMIVLSTSDSGKTWIPTTSSLFGRVERIRLEQEWSQGLVLLNFDNAFSVPSEVLKLDPRTGASTSIYRKKDRAITDVLLTGKEKVLLAGYEPLGELHSVPVPGKVKIVKSNDMQTWQEMDVDYRAVARNVTLAASPDGSFWAATDTGIILKLSE